MTGVDSDTTTGAASGARRQVPLGTLLERAGIAAEIAGATPGFAPAVGSGAAPAVESIEYDSRRVTAGTLFVAVRGFVTDGHRFVADAARAGAVAALVEEPTGASGILEVVVPDTRRALGLVAHEFYGRPSERLATHGITGTNGKTTTSYLVDSILRETGRRTGVVGTLGYRLGGRFVPGDMTSPESLDLARLMVTMVDEGVTAVTMEVSSHALSLGRSIGTRFDTATFTNLSRDHLDFHGSLEEYAAAKRILFELLSGDGWKPGATAVVNRDDAFGRELIDYLVASDRVRVLTYGLSEGDVRASDVATTPTGSRAMFHTPDGDFEVEIRLLSSFNVSNALAATGIAVSQGVPLDAIARGLTRVERVEGRLEVVDGGQDFTIVVDYAHTPDALVKVLEALRGLSPERLITVFGCGGDRDRGKRPMMGEIAAARSDVVIVTSDNPRTEEPATIIDEIVAGAGRGGGGAEIEVIEARRDAIARAVELARTGDIVLIAGKGHEDHQIIGGTRIHFDDREEALEAVRALRTGGATHGES